MAKTARSEGPDAQTARGALALLLRLWKGVE
jgi:hypothetical protein